MLKLYIVTLALSMTLLGRAYADQFVGTPYITECSHSMGLFGKGSETVEKRFVNLATAPGQKLQLLHDYKLVFSKSFQEAFRLLVTPQEVSLKKKFGPVQLAKAVRAKYDLPPEEFKKFVWKLFETQVDLKSQGSKDSANEVTFTQGKNLLAAIEQSPDREGFEKIMESIVRTALVEGWIVSVAKLNQPRGDSSVEYLVRVYITAMGLFGGGLAGLSIDVGSPIINSFMTLGAGVVGGIGTLLAFDKIMDVSERLVEGRFLRDSRRILGPKHTFDVLNPQGKPVALESAKLFEDTSLEDSESLALSIEKGCTKSPCELTPVQIAYLGHVNVLEVESLSRLLGESMKKVSAEEKLDPLLQAARDVYEDSKSYEKHIRLARAIDAFLEFTNEIMVVRSKAATDLVTYTDKFSENNLQILKDHLYKNPPTDPVEFAKYNLMAVKLEGDISNLAAIKVDSETLNKRLDKTQVILDKLKDLKSHLPGSNQGWGNLAEEVMLQLSELRAI